MLEQRTQEELTTELSVSIYDTARNDTAKKRREEIVSNSAAKAEYVVQL